MKKAICIVMAVVISMGLILNVGALEYGTDIAPDEIVHQQKFSDVPTTHWAFEYIAELVERGAINGYPNGQYYPNNTVTRVQFAKIMIMAAGLLPQSGVDTGYVDVPQSHWGAPYVSVAKPYMTAYQQNGKYVFKPDTPALREDIAVAVVQLKGYDTSIADMDLLRTMFSDYESISAAIRPYIAVAVEKGIISGYPDGTFRGQNSVTRAEAAAILWRAFQFGNDNKVITPTENVQVQKPTQTQTTMKPEKTEIPKNDTEKPEYEEPKVEDSEEVEEIYEEPVVQEKTYAVETVASIPKNADDMVFTKDGDIYYIKNNKLFEVSGGKTTELYDGNSDYYEEVMLYELFDEIEYHNDMGRVDELMYFDALNLFDLSYDSETDEVYIYARTNAVLFRGYEERAIWREKVYAITDMDNEIYSVLAFDLAHVSFGEYIVDNYDRYTPLVCGGGYVLYLGYNENGSYAQGRTVKINPSNKSTTIFAFGISGTDGKDYLKTDDGWYQPHPFMQAGSLYLQKFDLTSGDWISVNLADNNSKSATAFCENDGKIYFSANKEVYYYENAGTNRLKSVKYISLDDIEITDDIPMSKMSDMLFDDDGNILFADEEYGLIRKITKK